MSSDLAIKVDNLSKCYHLYDKPRDRLLQMLTRGRKQYYREFWALRQVSLEIKKGETIGIIGRNGSGKSTLLQIICGTLNPTSGCIQTNGRVAALLELGSGFNTDFTGRENIYINGAVLGLDKTEIDNHFDDIASFAEIGEFIEQPVKTYSSGMLIRLAFAVQAMVNPDLLIVDEALAVGDERFQRKCFARIEELKSKGASIVFVSHSGPQIIELCDHAMLLEAGECLMWSKPSEVVRSYQKLIYASADEQNNIVDRLRHHSALSASPTSSPKDLRPNSAIYTESQESSNMLSDDFDPALVPSTTTRYPERGASIDEIEIQNDSGKRVNVLVPGSTYRFILRGRFQASLHKVYFGIHIRTVTAAEITGQRFPEEGRHLESVGAGSSFEVIFKFKAALLPDIYFIGGGVWSADPICAHRVMDAGMFRVISDGSTYAFGYCNLSAGPTELMIS